MRSDVRQPMLSCPTEFFCKDVTQAIMGIPVWDIVTEKVLGAMREGDIPWVRPWSRQQTPRNAVSNRPYTGINLFLLAMVGKYDDPRWLTFKQAQDLGGNIKRGEKSTLIIFWKILDRSDPDNPDETVHFPLLRHYNVFNVEQAENLVKLKALPPAPVRTLLPIEAADKIVREMPNPPQIDHLGGNRAFYRPSEDAIHLPPRSAFSGTNEFYSTLFHEMGHSTGHKSRLNRLEESFIFGDPVYSREELVAEFCSAYLSSEAGIDSVIPNQAAYLGGWIKALGDDSKLLVVAASRGQKAARYILGELKAEDIDTQEGAKERDPAAVFQSLSPGPFSACIPLSDADTLLRVAPSRAEKWERCVGAVKAKGGDVNPFAVCTASIGCHPAKDGKDADGLDYLVKDADPSQTEADAAFEREVAALVAEALENQR